MPKSLMISPCAAPNRIEWHRTSVQILVLLTVLAFILPRLALLASASGVPLSDGKWYFDRAVSIAHGNGYAFDGTPTAFWPVAYPGFLALLFLLFPISPTTGLVANFFLPVVTVACSFRVFCELQVGTTWALFGTLVLAIFPNLIFYQNLLFSEILMTTLLSMSLLCMLVARRNYQLLLTGVLLGLTTLVKSQVFFLPVFIFIYDLWNNRQRKNVIWRYVVITIGIFIVVSPWSLRNYLVFDRFILVQSNGGYNLFMAYDEANRWGGAVGSAADLAERYPGVVADINKRFPDEMGMDDRATAMALSFISSHPVEVLRRVPYKLYRFFRHDPQGIGALLRSNTAAGDNVAWLSSLFQLSFWYYTIVLALAALSSIVFLVGPVRTRAHFVLLSTIVYFALVSAAFFGEGRFHIPILPAYVGCMLVTLHAVKGKLWPSGIGQQTQVA